MRCFLGAIAREQARRDQSLLVLVRAAQAEEESFKKVYRALEPRQSAED
jgi:hypothetical protein